MDILSTSGGEASGKVAGRRAPVKAEMNGLAPGLDRCPPSRWWVGKAANPLTVLGRRLYQLGGAPRPKIREGGQALLGLPALITTKQNRAGLSRLALKAPFILTLTASAGFAISPRNKSFY